MGEHARILATRVIEEIDNQLRRLTLEKDEAVSPSLQHELDRSIQRRLCERIAWERLLQEETVANEAAAPVNIRHKRAS
jgi:hypothetical protein